MSNRPNLPAGRQVKLYLDDIKEAIRKIESYTRGMIFDEFKNDARTIDAVVRNIEIIGEAAKHIPAKVRLKHMDVPWKEIIGTRSKVIHEYFGVDEAILWRTITEDLPQLKKQVRKIDS
ncbi:DUF86 domain-containing protein [Candidatus Gottesmanbacteria bacterium]|nr:DUF86 domain-containing protein [Candidatus Gottesmanbacteria bacterium]